MIRLLFVDDEPRILDGLRRMLRPMRKEWNLAFAPGGREALEYLAENEVDVVISDMRMPGMDGAELLTEVSRLYPKTVRIILSGHSDIEMILKSVGPSHQYLTKPTNPDDLKTIINNIFSLNRLLEDSVVKELVGGGEPIPSRPATYDRLVSELQKPDASMQAVGEVISEDATMAAQILRLVNSSYFGLRSEVTNVGRAVAFLGLSTVSSLVLSAHLFRATKPEILELLRDLRPYDHSQACAAIAKAIAEDESHDEKTTDNSFAAGLLHNTGQFILLTNNTERYKKVLDRVRQESIDLTLAEKEEFGADHADVGAYMLNIWGLPMPVIEAVALHHRPNVSSWPGFGPLAAVHVGAHLAEPVRSLHESAAGAEPDAEFLESLGLANRLENWRARAGEILQLERTPA